MHEQSLDLSAVAWSRQKETVRLFYKGMWDHAETALVPQIFHPDFTFRGSLGPRLIGHQEFIGYVRFVSGALAEYTWDILAIAEEGNQVFAKLRFHGLHRGELFGVSPTGRHVWWYGMPVFTFDGDLVRDLWVLGDIHGLIERLKGKEPSESWTALHSLRAARANSARGLTVPSSGRPPASFACLRPPLMSNVRAHNTRQSAIMLSAVLVVVLFAGWLGLAYVTYRIGMRFAPSFFGAHDPETVIVLVVLIGALVYALFS